MSASVGARLGDQRLERGVRRAADHHGVAAGEHGHRAHERARRRLLEQVAQDDHERALGALGAPERELVVAVARGAARGRTAPGRRRRRPGAAAAAPRAPRRRTRRAAAVAELVGDERERGRGVELGVEDRHLVLAERRGREPPGVDQQQQVAVLLEPVLVAHRPPEPRRRAPVDLADVVVGLVVADQLELGAEPERSAGGRALVAEAAAGDGEREPARRPQVREDADLGLARRCCGPSARARAGRSRASRRREHVPPAPGRRSRLAFSVSSPSRGSMSEARRARPA